jgi:hypothetical protein
MGQRFLMSCPHGTKPVEVTGPNVLLDGFEELRRIVPNEIE